MAQTPRDRLNRELETYRQMAEDGLITHDCLSRFEEFATALDESKVRHQYRDLDGNTKTYKPRSVEQYIRTIRLMITERGYQPLQDDAEEFNRVVDWMHDERGKAKTTLMTYQAAGRAFYTYHDDLGVDPEGIEYYNASTSPKHDELDMFTDEDVHALRAQCGATKMPTRNRALLELLIFTGQRITALITLRMGDVDTSEGYIYLNDEYDAEHGGLKGALRRGRKRPMFGARKYVRDYIQYHRMDATSDDWLFIGDPSHWKTKTGDHWARSSADHVLRRIRESAGVEKPVNAHNFRHYCATVLYRDYDLDRDTIRMLFGHVKTSSSLEKTYSHLFEDDYIRRAEEKLGYKDPERSKSFTPDSCPTCGEVLQEHWRQCPSCEEVFGPGRDFEEQLDSVVERLREEGFESVDADTIQAVRAIMESFDEPDGVADVLADLDTG